MRLFCAPQLQWVGEVVAKDNRWPKQVQTFFSLPFWTFFLRPVLNSRGKVSIVARVAFEIFLCTSASMGGRGGCRIIDGQNKSRLVLFAILDVFLTLVFNYPGKLSTHVGLG